MISKTCIKCLKNKKLKYFPFRRDNNTYRGQCIVCMRAWRNKYQKSWSSDNLERVADYSRKYRKNNKKIVYERKKKWRKENPEKSKAIQKRFYHKHKKRLAIINKQYRKENKDILREKKKVYIANRKKSDINFKLKIILRDRFNKAFVSNSKNSSAIKSLGCSIEEFKVYLESKFKDGMTWENYGQFGWHIDHIIPLSKFDLSKRAQIKKACHYTNLQPLWWKDNLIKGNKLEEKN